MSVASDSADIMADIVQGRSEMARESRPCAHDPSPASSLMRSIVSELDDAHHDISSMDGGDRVEVQLLSEMIDLLKRLPSAQAHALLTTLQDNEGPLIHTLKDHLREITIAMTPSAGDSLVERKCNSHMDKHLQRINSLGERAVSSGTALQILEVTNEASKLSSELTYLLLVRSCSECYKFVRVCYV